jgi:cellulose synthase/poly-beta-1,6-N-acetylglucosamine synthase-like glycosyltransferase
LRDNPKVKVYSKPNGGKASALNYGISRSDAEFVICIDADTKLLPDAVSAGWSCISVIIKATG